MGRGSEPWNARIVFRTQDNSCVHHIILKDGRGNRYANAKYNYIRAQQIANKADGVTLLDDDVAPVLPTVKEFLELPPSFEETQAQEKAAE